MASHERDSLLIDPSPEVPVDNELFMKLQEALGTNKEVFEMLTLDVSKQKEAAKDLSDGKDVVLTPDQIDIVAIQARREQLREFKRDLLQDPAIEPGVKQVYRWKVNEEIATTHMILAAQAGDMRSFMRWNEFIYGKPNEKIYRAGLDWVATDAESILDQDGIEDYVREAAQQVIDLIGDKRGDKSLLLPEEGTFEQLKQDHYRPGVGYYALLLKGINIPKPKVSREEGDKILEEVIRNIGSDYTIVDADGVSWSLAHSTREIKRPAKYNMVDKRFTGLALGHETGSHLLERINGERSPLRLAGSGLDRYELGNEGRAVMREQLPYDSIAEFSEIIRWRDIIRRHVAIGYAFGIDSDAGRSSSELYEFMNAIDYMYQARLKTTNKDSAQRKAEEKTSQLVLRVLRGTNGQRGVYLKDKIYLEGNIACWAYAAKEGVAKINDGDLGKFDITNPRHIGVLQEVGVLPS